MQNEARLEQVSVAMIDPNPFRLLGSYPYVERKIETLTKSIEDVGFWEGVIGRHKGNRVEIAFGHHRVEAARRMGMKSIPMVIRPLDDETMLMMMGRENGEDYNADFLVMLETWEAAWKAISEFRGRETTFNELASFLGWDRPHPKDPKRWRAPSRTAEACNAVRELIEAGHMTREDFAGLSVSAVRDLAQATKSAIKKVQEPTSPIIQKKTPAQRQKFVQGAVNTAKRQAQQVQQGNVGSRQAAQNIQTGIHAPAGQQKQAQRKMPEFAPAVNALNRQIDGMLNGDSVAAKIDDIVGSLPDIYAANLDGLLPEISEALTGLEKRARKLRTMIEQDPASAKVVSLNQKKIGA